VRDDLDGVAQVFAPAFLGDDGRVDLAGCDVGRALKVFIEEALVVADVQVRFGAVVWKGFIVPGSTFRYGSSFCIVTDRPRARRRWPRLEAVSPLPSEDATPPVTKMCLVVLDEPGNREFTREFDRCTTGFELIINSAFHGLPGGILM
jgi:hypothetical protein